MPTVQPKRKITIKNKRTFLIFRLLLLLSLFVVTLTGINLIRSIGDIENQAVEIIIPAGATTSDIAQILKEEKLIKSIMLFKVISKINNTDELYKQGKHILNRTMSYEEMMDELSKTVIVRDITHFTIPEGYELRQIASLLAQKDLIDEDRFMDLVENEHFNYAFLKDVPERENRLEGYLFPDTYEVYVDATEEEIINKMLDRFEEVFVQKYYQRANELGMTVDEVVTLASIIEREAQLNKERALVSAVFHNRMKSKSYPLLQSCATVQYILKERKPVLSTEDTKIDSPYNTYIYKGLPVGPIASPGKDSIHAALYPADVDYLFFVAKGDGSHIYSRTFNEHINAQNSVQR